MGAVDDVRMSLPPGGREALTGSRARLPASMTCEVQHGSGLGWVVEGRGREMVEGGGGRLVTQGLPLTVTLHVHCAGYGEPPRRRQVIEDSRA